MGAQTEQTLRNIEASLTAVGGEMNYIVSLLTHVTTLDGLAATHDVCASFFRALYPVSTQVATSTRSDGESSLFLTIIMLSAQRMTLPTNAATTGSMLAAVVRGTAPQPLRRAMPPDRDHRGEMEQRGNIEPHRHRHLDRQRLSR